jgi:hypothetical protein
MHVWTEPFLPEKPSLVDDFKVVGQPASIIDIETVLVACDGGLPQSYLNFLRNSDEAAECVSDCEGDGIPYVGE